MIQNMTKKISDSFSGLAKKLIFLELQKNFDTIHQKIPECSKPISKTVEGDPRPDSEKKIENGFEPDSEKGPGLTLKTPQKS